MMTGTSLSGTRRTYLGTLRNLAVNTESYDGVAVEWTLDQIQSIEALSAVYCDGRLQSLVRASTSGTSLSNLGDGAHTLSARLVGQDSTIISRVWHLGSQRVWIRWTPQDIPDLAAYIIQVYDATEDSFVDVATVTQRTIGELNRARQSSGTGFGHMTVFGNLNTTLSGTVSLIVNGTSLELYYASELVESRELVPLSTLIFSNGIRVYVNDVVEAYHTGDIWITTIGVECNWQSEVLEPGLYLYRVLAQDFVGNPSTSAGQFLVQIQQLPELANAPVFEIEEDEEAGIFQVSLNFSALPSDGSTLEVYSNYNVVLGTFMDSIYTRAPLAIITSDTQVIIPAAPPGFLKLYCWTRLDGVLRDDLTIYSTHLPATPDDLNVMLGAILNLELSYSTAGTPKAKWTYDFGPSGKDCTSFDVLFQINDDVPDWDSAQNFATDLNVTEQSGTLVQYQRVSGASVVTGDTLYVWIRARADEEMTGPSSTASVEVDIDPPPAPTVELAMPS